MKKIFLFVLYFSCAVLSFSQDLDTTVYENVDTSAFYPGGEGAWRKYVERSFNPSNDIKSGNYKVKVRFVVTKTGILKDFTPISRYGNGLEEALVMLLKRSGEWIPARKNGRNVNSILEKIQIFNLDEVDD